MISFSPRQHISAQIILILVILGNFYWLNSVIAGVLFGFIYLWLNSKKIADIYYSQNQSGLKNVLGLILLMSYISIIYTLAYHIYQINNWIFLFTLVSIPIIVETLSYHTSSQHYFFQNLHLDFIKPSKIRKTFLPALVFFLDVLLMLWLSKKASLGIIRSPWELVDYKFWILFTISNLALIVSLIDKKSYRNIVLISWHFLLLSSVAIITYPLGFGYDSFIHKAVLENIISTGTIEPRLFLYIGQYGLSIFSHQLFSLDIATANKILLPFLFSILWPPTIFYGLKYGFKWSYRNSYLATLWSVFLGFSFAIMTTPQSLAYLLAAVFVFVLPEINRRQISIYFALTISLMTMTIHPLVALPLFFFTLLLFIWRFNKNSLKVKIIKPIIYILASICLPFFFALYQKINGFKWSEIFDFKIWPLLNWPSPQIINSYSFPLDMLYNIHYNSLWIFALLILISIFFVFRENKFFFFKRLLYFSIILLINYFISKIFLSFNLQINYQKEDYINRIAYLLYIFLIPVFVSAVYFIMQAYNKNKKLYEKIILSLVSLFILTFGFYFSYPVYDKHGNSKSFNVTATDLKSVEMIEEDAQNQDYIVLANQMLGVAAINNYGFAHYYNENFFYSMPLGINNIYQNYLNMIEKNASREEAITAMDKAGVNRLYFIVNNYWHSAKQAIAQAEQTADKKILVDNGVNTIFVYQK